jgi:DNA-binding beta-propeller fold protein YncE
MRLLTFVSLLAASAFADSIPLPGGPPVGMDYLAYDADSALLFVPASNTGKVDVVNTLTGEVRAIDGWATEKRGERVAGVTAATTGRGYAYIGNRADSSICAVEIKTLTRKGCVTLPSQPDGVFYVSATREVWVTTPREKSLQIINASDPAAPALAGKISLEGEPEGYAVDEKRGIVFTNLEDKDRTLAIDAKARKVISTWDPACGEKGPRGIALDSEAKRVFVACAVGGVKELDEKGKIIAQLPTGAGLDNIDFLPAKHRLYAASSKDGKLTVAQAAPDGALKVVSTAETVVGGRTVIADAAGNAYIPDSKGGRLVVVRARY